LVSLYSIFLVNCSTVTPDKIKDTNSSFDESTPLQYNDFNGGIIRILDRGLVITPNAKNRYNHLISVYRIKMKKDYGVDLVENKGIKNYIDSFQNQLFIIDNEHAVYFGVMNTWIKEKVPQDSFIDKAVDKVTN
jgi:hypothetical protein